MSEETLLKIPYEIKQAIEEMPAISPIFNKLMELARNMEADPAELVKLIMIDPVLSGKVIRLVNSSYYGLTHQVNSLAQAVIMLGFNTVKNLAMHTAALDKLTINQKNTPLDPEAFWYHCLGTAVASKMIAKLQNVPPNELETYFLAGLLHDLGKILYLKAASQTYQKVLIESQNHKISLDLLEKERFGFTHNQIGGLLAKKWKLDPSLIGVIESHHCSDISHSENHLMKPVIIANNLCKQHGLGQSGNPVVEESARLMAASLNINDATLQLIANQLPQELEKAVNFLKTGK